MFERGSIYRAIRNVLARYINASEKRAYQIATSMVKKGEIPDSSNKKFWQEVKEEYQLQTEMINNPNPHFDDELNLPVIARKVKAIEYLDVVKAKAENVKEPHRMWRHDFKGNDIVAYGLYDGSILIRSKSNKKLWGYR